MKQRFETHAEFFHTDMKAQWDEGGGRILLGDKTVGGAVMLRQIGFRQILLLASALEFGFQLDSLAYTYRICSRNFHHSVFCAP